LLGLLLACLLASISTGVPVTGAQLPVAKPTTGAEATSELSGKWIAVSAEIDGAKVRTEDVQGLSLSITGRAFTLQMGEEIAGSYTHDDESRPKTIDLSYIIVLGKTNRLSVQVTRLGIYELDKDTLRICLAQQGDPRPRVFSAAKGMMLLTLRRDKLN
jgi:uncharacterized protein (TIGR03067 family)